MSLDSLGLTQFEESVYRALLRDGGSSVDGEREVVRAAVARLEDLELVATAPDGAVVAAAAEVGVPRLIRRRMREANAELSRISGAWETVHALATEGRAPSSYEGMERIESVEEASARVWSLSLDAREVLAVHHKQRKVVPDDLPRYVERLGDGVEWRTILPREHVNDPAVAEYCLRLHRAGDRHRLTDEVVQQMVILDRAVAFVPLVPNAPGSGALMIRQEGAVTTLVDLFERVWAHATDLESNEPRLTERERQVLHLMTTTVKDEISAREMDVSLRTYRRYVAELLVRLEASNRVQAALIARQRGWI